MSIELKPCPFCGASAKLALGESDINGAEVFCTECYASAGHHADDANGDAATRSWNTRTAIQQAEAKTDEPMATIDLDLCAWESIKESAAASPWIPHQYFQNDWVNDVCSFLRHPAPGVPDWAACLRIMDAPEVDEALRLFAEGEATEDQAVAIVQAVLTAAQAQKGQP